MSVTPIAVQQRAVSVEGLRVELAGKGTDIVDGVSFNIAAGEVLALIGESGSGKTTVGLAFLGYQRRGARIAGGRILVSGSDVLAMRSSELRALRGRVVAYVPQDPSAALNPATRVGVQLAESLSVHGWGESDTARHDRVREMLAEVSLPVDEAFLRRYPHQLSGGQQQRVVLALAFACHPAVVVLDEPTTGLDVTTQAHVLRTVRQMTQLHAAAVLYVSHDLSVVANFADRVAVMYAGCLVEQGGTQGLFNAAAHPYTRLLLNAVPRIDGTRRLNAIPGAAPSPGSRPVGCPFAPRCDLRIAACEEAMPPRLELSSGHEVRCLRATEVRRQVRRAPRLNADQVPTTTPQAALQVRDLTVSYGYVQVVSGITLNIDERECLALVGESGSGKTTVARSIAGLHPHWTGEVRFEGDLLPPAIGRRSREHKRALQYIFQNPYGSLNPRRTVAQSVARPLTLLNVRGREAQQQVDEMLALVSLPSHYGWRYPHELSGGERQRVAIARALICRPRVLLCDEVTSALDVSVQAAIVTLLGDLQQSLGLSILFVTHNLPLVRSIAQRVAVMREGHIVEEGAVDQVLDAPADDYTRRLIADAPKLEQTGEAFDETFA